jgi:hypothetical protein
MRRLAMAWLGLLTACGSEGGTRGAGGGGGEDGVTSATSPNSSGNSGMGASANSATSTGAGGDAEGELRAFPGAEGFGTDTPGGRGGRVIVVDTLASDGPGSFREAMLATGPRTIVFRVSGVIELEDGIVVGEANSYVTVAGQTSPGGITFRGELSSYRDNFHDAVFRFVRFRGQDNYDNLALNDVHHIVFDHCDFSGAEDETLDITFARDVTVQWSTIANSETDGQNYGILMAYPPTTNITMHHNLSAHHAGRCAPQFHWDVEVIPARVDFRNNVVYNCAFDVGFYAGGFDALLEINLVGNYFKVGPSSPSDPAMFRMPNLSRAFSLDNGGVGHVEFSSYSEHSSEPQAFAAPLVTTHSLADGFEAVMKHVGAFPRDAMNDRTVNEARTGTGSLGKTDDPLILDGPAAPTDDDRDGMPDDWEINRGLSPTDPMDALGDDDADGYTNLEEYLHGRAMELLPN